jgi:hypothetical protein
VESNAIIDAGNANIIIKKIVVKKKWDELSVREIFKSKIWAITRRGLVSGTSMKDQDDRTEYKLSETPFTAWTLYTRGPLARPLLKHGDRLNQIVYQDIETRESDFTVISKA